MPEVTKNSTVREHHEVIIVGSGQAGLSLSWHLTKARVDHVLLERNEIAHEWRTGRWDNFTLVTPNWQCQLPGYPYRGSDPDGFMRRDEVYAFVRSYADSFDAPVREGVEVTGLRRAADGGFDVDTSAGEISANQVVVATGGYHKPIVPAYASAISPDVTQLHSSLYRSSDQLPPGAVLVVGTGQSGTQIAEDLHLAGRAVHLALGNAPRVARFYRGRDCVAWLDEMGVYDVPVEQQAGGLAKRENTNHYVTGRDGGRDIDLRQFAVEGMSLYGRLTGARGHRLQFDPTLAASLDSADAVAASIKVDIDRYIERAGIDALVEEPYRPVWTPSAEPAELDLATACISSIIWSIGYRPDYSWLSVGVFDGAGHPTHNRGVTTVPGLHFLGLPWLHTWGSGRFAAISRDAEHLSEQIAEARARSEMSLSA